MILFREKKPATNEWYWHLWFAWRPVKTPDGIAWLEYVERRSYLWGCGFAGGMSVEYRRAV